MSIRMMLPLVLTLLAAPDARPSETARYRLELEIVWSEATHPFEFPPSAHLTTLVGATHDQRYVLFRDGRTASSGLESVAERGRTAILKAEMQDAQGRARVGATFEGNSLETVPGRISANFTATERHSLVSFVTMIAPSPDWFTGAAGIRLFEHGTWLDRIEVILWAWDAGTDSGPTYSAEEADTQPRESVRLLAGPQFLGQEGLRRMGTATLVRTE